MIDSFAQSQGATPIGADFLGASIQARAAAQAQARRVQDPEAQEKSNRIIAALAHPDQILALELALEGETPQSYWPGMDFANTAYLEGRKAGLRDLIHFLTHAQGKAA